jgi:hypothetical protein
MCGELSIAQFIHMPRGCGTDAAEAAFSRWSLRPAINLVGRTFGRLTVLAREGSTGQAPRRPLWRCRCSCGCELVVRAASLLAGRTRSWPSAALAPLQPPGGRVRRADTHVLA